MPDGTEAVTGETVAQENSDAVEKDLKMVGILFMIFAGIALFVGSFIIWNTFTMIVTQRSREIALLQGHRRHPAPGAAQPAARGGPARGRGLRDRHRPRTGASPRV